MTHPAELRIFLLGPLRIEREGTAIHLPRRKVEALLAWLLLHPQRHTRDALATLFWGDSPDEKARHSLRTALAALRQHLGETLLLADREGVQIDPASPIFVDLRQFVASVQPADGLSPLDGAQLQAALALWQGPLLEGFYDDWVIAEREHWHTRLGKLLLDLAHALRARSNYPLAIAAAHKVLHFDAANEHAHQQLMFCYMAAGDRAAALRQYDLCERALEAELDASPAAETTALYLWIKGRGEGGSPYARLTNLPIPLTSFVGRTQETAAVKRLLDPAASPAQEVVDPPARLLTITGPGGSGKTRLAIQAATDLIDRFPHGVWFVELATLGTGDQVAHAVAKALGVSEDGARRCLDSIADALGDRRLLLVLDNCEHLVEPLAHFTAELLSRCPHLHVLATSRDPLNIPGEVRWQAPPLALPDPQQPHTSDLLRANESVRLFAERAATVQQDFRLSAENGAAIAAICTQLDGMPLAIELAAARVRMLPVAEIAARLASTLGARFALLTQGSRTALPRHQTLRAAIDWSYDLLAPAERQLFCQLAVFRGGFTLGAAEQVAELDAPPGALPGPTPSLLDLLGQLVDRSLVIVDPQEAQHRYRLLETLREYAWERLAGSTQLRRLQERHAACFLHLAEQADAELTGSRQAQWLDCLELEHANLRAALRCCLHAGSASADASAAQDSAAQAAIMALHLAAALMRFWDYRGYVQEGRTWLRQALALPATEDADLPAARAMTAASWLAYREGDYAEALRLLLDALPIFERAEEETSFVDALQILAMVEADSGEYGPGKEHLEHSLRLAETLNYAYGLARGLRYAGAMAWDEDRFEEALAFYRASLLRYQELGDGVSIATAHLNVGDTERMLGNAAAAQANYAACLQLAHSLGNKGLTGAVLKSMGILALVQGEVGPARQYGEEALALLREVGDKGHTGFALSHLGDVALELGDQVQALACFAQSLQLMHDIGYKWPMFDGLEDIARLLAANNQQHAAAARFLGAADSLRAETGIAVPPEQMDTRNQLERDLRHTLGDEAFAAQRHAGAAAPLDQIVAEATRITLIQP